MNKSACCKAASIDIRLFTRQLPLNGEELISYFKTRTEIIHEQKVIEKEEKIRLVREMYEDGYYIRGIVKELNFTRETIRKYLQPMLKLFMFSAV